MYANVIIEITAKSVDKMFTYKIPEKYQSIIKVGSRVIVPFGTKILEGFVLGITNNFNNNYEVKEIIELIDIEPLLNNEMLYLGDEISEKTLCSKISAYQVMLPKALKASHKTNINIKEDKYIKLNLSEEEVLDYLTKCRYEKQKEILTYLLENKELKITKQDSTINTLLKNNLITLEKRESYRYNYITDKQDRRVLLNEEQQTVVDRVLASKNTAETFLLYGVTGAGKTEVYMNIIESIINDDKTAIMLVPEISLTPQIVERFILRFGHNVAILHSGLSDGEKYDEYRKIKDGKVKIVVGARSAIFAPLKNLGIIIIDEEHTSTYKQDNHPRYHARDIAILRSNYHNCPLLLGSATPSLESMARACNKIYTLLTITKRAGKGTLPSVYIVDMKDEIKKGNNIFSSFLDRKIKEKLEKKEQVILLLNRRGYTSVETCNKCGETIKCPNCDISLTYHKTSDMLRCHYCGYATKKYLKCPKCNSTDLKDYG